jgi:hypothetical protein
MTAIRGCRSAAIAAGTVRRKAARRSAEKLCGAVSVVTTLGPRRRSCCGTQMTSATPRPARLSSMTMENVLGERRRSARMYGTQVRPRAIATSGQGGANWVPGLPKRSAGDTGPQGAINLKMPLGATFCMT